MKAAAGLSNQTRPLKDGAVVGLLLMAATAGAFLVDHQVSLTSQAMLYVLAVVLAS